MSYTTRPTVSRVAAGRGRGAVGGAEPEAGSAPGMGGPTTGTQPQPQPAQEAVQRKNGFTMFTPDQKKRDKIAKQAKMEEANFTRYKEKQKLGHVSYVGTAGGGLSSPEATQHKVQQNTLAPLRKQITFQEHRTAEKEQQQSEINKRKAGARVQAIRNESKESDRQARLDEDRRLKNDAFLKRFERGGKF